VGARFAVVQGHPRDPRLGSLKSPYRTSYRSSIDTIAVDCLVIEKTAYAFQATDRRTY